MKGTKKLILAVFTCLFALIAISSATFAWFSLSEIAKVSDFDMTFDVLEGLEISPDNGITWYSTLTFEKDDKVKLTALTSLDGKTLTHLEEEEVKETEYYSFDLMFRSKAPGGVQLKDVKSTSELIGFQPTVPVTLKDGITYGPYESKKQITSVRASNAIRLGISTEEKGLGIYVVNKGEGEGDYETKDNSSSLRYYNTRSLEELDLPNDYNYIPELSLGDIILKLNQTEESGEYYIANATFNIWAEGWDADCFDAVLGANLKMNMQFRKVKELDFVTEIEQTKEEITNEMNEAIQPFTSATYSNDAISQANEIKTNALSKMTNLETEADMRCLLQQTKLALSKVLTLQGIKDHLKSQAIENANKYLDESFIIQYDKKHWNKIKEIVSEVIESINQYDITIDVTLSTESIPELESLVESIQTKMTEAGIKTFEEELG